MHAFIMGGTGRIGSAVVAELRSNGHTVLALARSDASAQSLTSAGAEPLREISPIWTPSAAPPLRPTV